MTDDPVLLGILIIGGILVAVVWGFAFRDMRTKKRRKFGSQEALQAFAAQHDTVTDTFPGLEGTWQGVPFTARWYRRRNNAREVPELEFEVILPEDSSADRSEALHAALNDLKSWCRAHDASDPTIDQGFLKLRGDVDRSFADKPTDLLDRMVAVAEAMHRGSDE